MSAATPPPPPPESDSEPAANLLLPLILLGVAALSIGTYLLLGKGCAGSPPKKETPISEEKLERYREGDLYRTIVNTTVHGQVETQDWSVKPKATFLYQGELDTIREVVKKVEKEGKTEVTMDLQVRRARDLQVGIELEDLTLDIPPVVGNVLNFGAALIPEILPGQKLPIDALKKQWIRSGLIDGISAIVEKTTGTTLEKLILPEPPTIDAFEGAGATFIYRADVGLSDVQTRGQLSAKQEDRLKDFSVFAESYILPAPDGKPGDEWDVDVTTIAHLLVPTSKLEATGTLTFQRGETGGDTVELKIVRGLVEFSGTGESTETLGSWAARGSLFYNLADNTVVGGRLTGAIKLERSSTDHILFESKWTAKPEYQVLIHGYRATSKADAEKDIVPFEQK